MRQLMHCRDELIQGHPLQPKELEAILVGLQYLPRVAFIRLINGSGADNDRDMLHGRVNAQRQFQRARDIEEAGYAGDVRGEFPGIDELTVGVQEENGYTGKQSHAIVKQEPERRCVGRNDQLRPWVTVLVLKNMTQAAQIARIPDTCQIERFRVDPDLHVGSRGKSPHESVIPIRIDRQAVSERVQHKHPVRFLGLSDRNRRGTQQHQRDYPDSPECAVCQAERTPGEQDAVIAWHGKPS